MDIDFYRDYLLVDRAGLIRVSKNLREGTPRRRQEKYVYFLLVISERYRFHRLILDR
jgi:hypothetical protein